MAQPHAKSGEPVRLGPLGERIGQERTTAILKGRQLEVVRLVLPAGKRLREHAAPGEITVLVLEGEMDFGLPGVVHRLGPADFIHLAPGEPHWLQAVRDTSALVTICLAAPG